MADQKDFRRRALGLCFLLGALGMLIAGESVLQERLRARPVWFLLYWAGCFAFVGLAFMTAVVDWVVVRRRLRAERSELLESTLKKIAQTQAAPAEKSPEKSGDKE